MSRNLALYVIAMILALSALGWSDAGCAPPPTLRTKLRVHATAELYSQLGTWFGEHKQFECAADAYENALKLKPGSSRLTYLLGLSLFSGGHAGAAIVSLKESVAIAPNVLQPHVILASALERLQRNDEAKSEWQTALRIDPHSVLALDGVARALLREGKQVEVISLLGTSPVEEDLIADLAQSYVALKRFEDASGLLTSGLHKKPHSLRLANAMTQLELLQRHYQAAEIAAERSAKLHPDDAETQKLYLQTMVSAGSLQKARELAPKLLAQSPQDLLVLYLNGVLEHDAGDLQAARGHLQKAVDVDPKAAAPHYSLGQVLAQLNDPKGAKEELEKALELGATQPEIHLELGKALRALGEQQAASEHLRLYQQELRVRQTRGMAASKVAQGDKALQSGDTPKAVGLYREALGITPDDAQLQYKLAVVLDHLGDVSAESIALEQAVHINPDLAVAHNQLGFLASKRGDLLAAEKHFREAARSAPGFTEAWVNLAATLGLQSRFSEAEEAVTAALKLEPRNPQALLLRDTVAKALAQPQP
jgi:tetratricopeptide (TPR) repeat protein